MKEFVAKMILLVESVLSRIGFRNEFVSDTMRRAYAFVFEPQRLCMQCGWRWAFAGSSQGQVACGYGSDHDTSVFGWKLFCPPIGPLCDHCINNAVAEGTLVHQHTCVVEGCFATGRCSFGCTYPWGAVPDQQLERALLFEEAVYRPLLTGGPNELETAVVAMRSLGDYPTAGDSITEYGSEMAVLFTDALARAVENNNLEAARANAQASYLLTVTEDLQREIQRLNQPPTPYAELLFLP